MLNSYCSCWYAVTHQLTMYSCTLDPKLSCAYSRGVHSPLDERRQNDSALHASADVVRLHSMACGRMHSSSSRSNDTDRLEATAALWE
jgi:hypothetical protein